MKSEFWTPAHDIALQRARGEAPPKPPSAPELRDGDATRAKRLPRFFSQEDRDRLARIEVNLDRLGVLTEIRALCKRRAVTLLAVVSKNRYADVARLRHEIWTILYDTLDLGWSQLGRVFEVEHSTVMHAVKARHEKLAAMLAATASSTEAA